MAPGVADGGNQPPALVRGLRHDPHHAPELVLLHEVPQLSPQVRRWHAAMLRRHPQTDVDKLAAKIIRRATATARLVDLLVIQGRHPDAEAASAALRAAGAPAPGADGHHVPNPFTALKHALRQVPGMIGMRFNAFRRGGPVNATLSVAKVASYLVPVVGIPAWAVDQARATRKLGSDAVNFYAVRTGPDSEVGVLL